MKTRSIARGIVGSVAALLGVMAAGCSADVSDPQSGEAAIGSTSEALISRVGALTSGSVTADRAASCYMKNSTTGDEYLVAVGGDDGTSTSLASIRLYKYAAGAGTWVTQSTVLPNVAADLKAIRIDDETCVVTGGVDLQNGTYQTDVTTLSLVKNTRPTADTIAVTARTALNTARSEHALLPCKDGNGALHLVAMGGVNGSGAIASIEVSDSSAPTGWHLYNASGTQLTHAKYDFGAMVGFNLANGSNGAVALGGFDGSSRFSDMDVIKFADGASLKCEPTVTNFTSFLGSTTQGNALIFDGANGATGAKFRAIAGKSGTTLIRDEITFNVAFGSTPPTFSSKTTNANALPVGVYRPTVVDADPTSHVKWALTSGATGAASPAALAVVQGYNAGWTDATNGSTTSRLFASAIYLPSAAKVVVAEGLSTAAEEYNQP